MNWKKFTVTVLIAIVCLSFVSTRGASTSLAKAPTQLPLNVAALVAKAQANGTVPVIVGLRIPFQTEGNLVSPTLVQNQRVAIRRAQDALLTQMAAYNAQSVRKFSYIPYMAMWVDAAALTFLSTRRDVSSIEEDMADPLALAESVPLIGAPTVWASGYTGAGQVVAVLDTGVDKTHPFLVGKVVSEACYSNGGGGGTSVCPGGVNSTAPGSGVNCSPAISGCSHGTHVAGIAAGKDNGSIGFSGVARDANVIAVQVFTQFGGSVSSYVSDQILGLERVQTLSSSFTVATVNMSLGGGRYYDQASCDSANTARKAAIDNLRSLKIATVIASGNSGYTDSMSAPGCISTAISVGATGDGSSGTTVDAVMSYSNSASFLNLLAPGSKINSSTPGNTWGNWDGTSMATPHVAGAWALLKSKVPSATVNQVLSALTTTGLPVTDSRNSITKPRIRLDLAANALEPPNLSVYLPFVARSDTGTCGFNSQFNGSAPGWQFHTGTWSVDSNYLRCTGAISTGSSASYTQDYSNFTYEARLIRYGSDTNANRLWIRGTVYPLGSTNWWYNGYLFQYTRNGAFSVYKSVAATSTSLQSWTTSSAINQGDAWNTLRVVANGSSLSFYINGTLVWSGSDASLTSGQVGVGMYSESSDQLLVDWATLTCGTSTSSSSGTISREQHALNDAANARRGGNPDTAPSRR